VVGGSPVSFFMTSAVLAAGLLVIFVPAAAVVLRLEAFGGWAGSQVVCL
jgi:hypothetical protein